MNLFHDFTIILVSGFLTKREYANTMIIVCKRFSKFKMFAQDQFPNGVVKTDQQLITYMQGKMHGRIECYFDNGNISMKRKYFNSKIQ